MADISETGCKCRPQSIALGPILIGSIIIVPFSRHYYCTLSRHYYCTLSRHGITRSSSVLRMTIECVPIFQYSSNSKSPNPNIPIFQYSSIPISQYSNRPVFQYSNIPIGRYGLFMPRRSSRPGGQEKSDMGDFLGRSYIARGGDHLQIGGYRLGSIWDRGG